MNDKIEKKRNELREQMSGIADKVLDLAAERGIFISPAVNDRVYGGREMKDFDQVIWFRVNILAVIDTVTTKGEIVLNDDDLVQLNDLKAKVNKTYRLLQIAF